MVAIGEHEFPIGRVYKVEGDTWLTLKGAAANPPRVGDLAAVSVNAERRRELSRSHTLCHLMMAAGKACLEDFDSKGAAIDETGR
ncbi:hypothetical protein [Pararhizobium sp. A13]|uniref:hypothetical protein n=1 Tax=Pararhizobium sp. A13 TaxID=3133975 RepID=UPI00311B2DAF